MKLANKVIIEVHPVVEHHKLLREALWSFAEGVMDAEMFANSDDIRLVHMTPLRLAELAHHVFSLKVTVESV